MPHVFYGEIARIARIRHQLEAEGVEIQYRMAKLRNLWRTVSGSSREMLIPQPFLLMDKVPNA